MEDGAGGVEGLQLVLDIQRCEDVLGVAHGQVGGVGVVGGLVAGIGCSADVGITLDVLLGKTVGGGLGGGRLKVVEVAILLLIVGEALAHVVEYVLGEFLGGGIGHVLAKPLGVETDLIHAEQTDGGEVVVEGAEVAAGVGIETLVQQLGDDVALDLQRTGSDVHHAVKTCIELLGGLGEIGNTGHVDGNDTDGAGGLTAAEEAAGLLAKLAQVKTETAAHGTHVGGLHVGVDVVGEVGGAVLGGHFKQELVVLGLAPVEVPGDGVGGDGVLEATAVGVALDHDLDEGLVDHVHFLLAVAVGEVHLLAAHDGGQVLQILGNSPVQGDVGEGSLSAPAAGGVHAVDEGLDALLDFLLGQVVHLDEGSQIGVEGGEGLCAGPLVLHDAQEVDHLVAEGGEVTGGAGSDLAGDTAQAFHNQLLQAPACAVAGEHAKVVQVQSSGAVGFGDLVVVDLGEPVVGGDGTGVGEDQTADGIGDGGVLLHAPVGVLDVLIHGLLIVKDGGAHVTHLFVLAAVEDVCLGNVGITGLNKHGLDAVLDILNGNEGILDLGFKVGGDLQCEKVDDVVVILTLAGIKGLADRAADLGNIKGGDLTVTLNYLVHGTGLSFVIFYGGDMIPQDIVFCQWGKNKICIYFMQHFYTQKSPGARVRSGKKAWWQAENLIFRGSRRREYRALRRQEGRRILRRS